MARDIHNLVAHLQENPIPTGKELEFSLIGPGPANKFDPEKLHDGKAEKNIRNFDEAVAIVKGEIDARENKAEDAEEDSPDFKYAEITTHPESPYAYAVYTELCKLLDFDDPSSKKIRYYNTLDSVLDVRFGTDFMIEIHPSTLQKNKFGDEVERLTKPMYITVDVTTNAAKSHAKADVVLQYDKLPDSRQEQLAWGREAAIKIAQAVVRHVKFSTHKDYQRPLEKELQKLQEKPEAPKPHGGTVTKIRAGVVRRVKSVESKSVEDQKEI